jgi:hypothetical protein
MMGRRGKMEERQKIPLAHSAALVKLKNCG